MSALGSKLRRVQHARGVSLSFWCPGCRGAHMIKIIGGPPIWAWDGNIEAPTISPSIKVTHYGRDREWICHSFVRNGQIQFLGDCDHDLKNQTVPIPDWPADYHDGDQAE